MGDKIPFDNLIGPEYDPTLELSTLPPFVSSKFSAQEELCLIDRLPDDILVAIFGLALRLVWKRRRAQSRLTKVCLHWQRIMLDSGVLWANLHSGMPSKVLDVYLARSGTAPLNIFRDETSEFAPPAWAMYRSDGNDFLLKMVPYNDRWGRVTIWRSRATHATVWSKLPSHLPNAIELDLRGWGSPRESYVLKLICPRIRDISFQDISFNWRSPHLRPGGLHSLRLIRTCVDLEDLVKVISSSPGLEMLVLDQVEEYTGNHVQSVNEHGEPGSFKDYTTGPIVSLPKLTMLHLTDLPRNYYRAVLWTISPSRYRYLRVDRFPREFLDNRYKHVHQPIQTSMASIFRAVVGLYTRHPRTRPSASTGEWFQALQAGWQHDRPGTVSSKDGIDVIVPVAGAAAMPHTLLDMIDKFSLASLELLVEMIGLGPLGEHDRITMVPGEAWQRLQKVVSISLDRLGDIRVLLPSMLCHGPDNPSSPKHWPLETLQCLYLSGARDLPLNLFMTFSEDRWGKASDDSKQLDRTRRAPKLRALTLPIQFRDQKPRLIHVADNLGFT